MNTECTHCGKLFHVSDRALGKRAKCKACGKVFVVRPSSVEDVPMQEVGAPPAMGSARPPRSRPRPDNPKPVGDTAPRPPQTQRPIPPDRRAPTPTPEPDDPLAALADAADTTLHDHADEVQEHARSQGSYLTRREHGEHGRVAPGALASMVLGIIALALAPVVVGGVVAIFAVIQGNSARRRIRRSRGVLEGRGKALAGLLMGWIALGLLAVGALVAVILLIRSGPVVIDQTEKIVN